MKQSTKQHSSRTRQTHNQASTLVRLVFASLLLILLWPVSLQADALKSLNGLVIKLPHSTDTDTDTDKKIDFTEAARKGHWLLVKLWSVDCGICRAQVPTISALHEDRQSNHPVSVVGITIDPVERENDISRYLSKTRPSYPNIRAHAGTLAHWFESITAEPFRGTPTYLLFDSNGALAAIQTSILQKDSLEKFMSRYQAN